MATNNPSACSHATGSRRGRHQSSLTSDAGQLARFAVRTIAADQPIRRDDVFSGLASQGDLDVALGLLCGNELRSPSHLAPKFSQSCPQLPLDLGLPDEKRTTYGGYAGHRAHLDAKQRSVAGMKIQRQRVDRPLRQVSERTEPLENLRASRLQAERAGGRRGAGCLVDDGHVDAAAAQVASQGKSRRARSGDENACSMSAPTSIDDGLAHGDRSSLRELSLREWFWRRRIGRRVRRSHRTAETPCCRSIVA